MYLKGYRIKYDNNRMLNFPKWDFGGDRSYTNSFWNKVLSQLRALPPSSYPLSILDLDKEGSEAVNINNREEFEEWMLNDF